MMPGYRTLPHICEAAGFTQPLHTHTGGGMTGSVRYKWEQENGIFSFDRKPKPKPCPQSRMPDGCNDVGALRPGSTEYYCC